MGGQTPKSPLNFPQSLALILMVVFHPMRLFRLLENKSVLIDGQLGYSPHNLLIEMLKKFP
jgi:hypothetical protein